MKGKTKRDRAKERVKEIQRLKRRKSEKQKQSKQTAGKIQGRLRVVRRKPRRDRW